MRLRNGKNEVIRSGSKPTPRGRLPLFLLFR
uniref:Uncharacterized protein n=1 Tax=Siphoviridae sp. ctdvJ3 TaxID=2827903 RepID=A0A8S5SC34_9CAUD|nr:MAG TPA: hypothetical protein [Siphoviridae sp. ctdvJ3]